MSSLPTGTVTFLFTDIEGSTRLLQHLEDAYADVLGECRRLVRTAVQERGGLQVDTEGDAVFAAFPSAREALMAAVTAQQHILRHPWPDGATVKVRMGLHTGEARVAEGGYVGMDVHRAARICAAAHGGQILVSDVTQGLVTRDLPDGVSLRDLGEHRLKDLAHPHRLFQVLAADLSAEFPRVRSLDTHRHNLPIQLTSFIGREREIAEVKRLLDTARLVTLTGSGGAGKTRLALQVAADVVESYPDGAWFAEFAPIADPALVPKTVASALNVTEQPGRDITETLVDALRSKAPLLVLDNCEHILAACRDLAATLLHRCPQVRIIATSREGLEVLGERVWRVASLSVPDLRHPPDPDEIVLYEAVRLFVDRAVASTPAFTITSGNARSVAQICHRLDGIPLAIELAAARVRVLSADQIAVRLDDRFRLLTGGSPLMLPRHQTLRAAIDWSYNLLSEAERVLLRRLSVFAGGWTLEAAEAVCADESMQATTILDRLTSLLDKSLVLAETGRGEARYRLLETVRQYAHERLNEAGEVAEVRAKHRTWYLGLAEHAQARLGSPEQTMWLKRLEEEHDNLRTALGWTSPKGDDTEPRLRLAAALWEFWNVHTHWSEGRKWLEIALAGTRDIKSTARALALCGQVSLALRQGDYDFALEPSVVGLALARELADQRVVACLLMWRGLVAQRQGDFDTATGLFVESLALARKFELKQRIGYVLSQMGALARHRRDYANAVALCEESLAVLRTVGGKWDIAYALRLTGHAVRLQGNSDRAKRLYTENLALFGETGDKWITTECIEGLALISCGQGSFERAARLFGTAEAARKTFAITTPKPEGGDQEQFWTPIREGPAETAFAAAWAEGRAMTLEQAIEYALAVSDE